MEEKYNKFKLQDRLIDFVIIVSDIVDVIPNTKLGNYLSGQLIRSGTSPALNYGEVLGAESQKDFIHKMGVCLKELRETFICFKILSKKKMIEEAQITNALNESNELVSIFVSSVNTAKKNLK